MDVSQFMISKRVPPLPGRLTFGKCLLLLNFGNNPNAIRFSFVYSVYLRDPEGVGLFPWVMVDAELELGCKSQRRSTVVS